MVESINDIESDHDFPGSGRPNSAALAAGAPRGVLEIVWSGRWVVLGGVVLGILASFIYLNTVEPRFTSAAKLLVEKNVPAVLPGAESKFVTDSKNYLNTHAAIIKADPVIQSAVERGGLDDLPSAEAAGSAFAYLKANLQSEVGAKDDILVLRLESASADESRHMVASVIEAYMAYQGGEIMDSAQERMSILSSRLETLREESRARQKALRSFQAGHQDTALSDDRGSAVLRRLGQLNDKLTLTEIEVREATQEYEIAEKLLADTSDIQIWRDSLAALVLGSNLSAMEGVAYQRMLDNVKAYETDGRRFGENHPANLSAKQAKQNLEAVVSERERLAADTYLAHLLQQKNAVETQLEDLVKAVDEQQHVVLDYQEMSARLNELRAAVEQTRVDIEVCEQRLREAEAVVATPQNIRVLEHPVPGKKTHPKPANQLLVIGGGLGFVFGAMIALPLGLRDDRKQASLLAMHQHGIPSVGSVPPIPAVANKLDTITSLSSLVDVVEAYRMVRTAIEFTNKNQAARSFLVTSPATGDGKTTTTTGLALAMARPENPVLVIDADLRRGVLHEKLGVENAAGLCEVLQGLVSIDEVIQETSVPGLYLLPRGGECDDPSRLLGRSTFRNMLAVLGDRFDRVLVDSPPAVVADTPILAAQVDATLMVLRYGKSTQVSTLRAIEVLQRANANIIGSVTNSISERVRDQTYMAYGYNLTSHGRSEALFATPAGPVKQQSQKPSLLDIPED